MFRFVKYFFTIFLITMVIPLLSMFFWTHAKEKHMTANMHKDRTKIMYTKVKAASEQYLELQESDILTRVYEQHSDNMTLTGFQKLLNNYHVEPLSQELKKITSYYEIGTSPPFGLYSVTVLPVKHSKLSGIKVLSRVDTNKLHPGGPFKLKLIYLDDEQQEIYEERIDDPASMHRREHPPAKHFQRAPSVDSTIELNGSDGQPVAQLVITSEMPMPPPGIMLDNVLGIIILFMGILLSLITGLYINKSFIKPLLRISDGTKHVTKGDLSFRLPIDVRQKYILDTYRNFNEMIAGLKEKDDLRKSFISNLTHDLRTPLLAQERSLDLISQKFKALDLNNEYELSKSLQKNNSHLLRMVNLILDSYSFDSAQLKIVYSEIKISKFIDSCYEKLKPLVIEKNISFKNDISTELPPIKGDSVCFERIFINLISNAIENSLQNGEIRIYSNIEGNSVKIYVEDNGNGISEEDINFIFDRYYSGKSYERKLGTGLGLDVCKKLIEMHNGSIEVESKLGHFTRFIVTLPFNVQKGA